MKERIKNLGIFKLYTLVFFIVFIIACIPLSIRNLNIGFSGLFSDALTQHVLFMRDYVLKIREWITSGNQFEMYSFNIGMGADTISSYAYYNLFDPFNIIAIILPIKWIEFSFYLILTLKLYLSGLFFIMFAKKILVKNKWALLATGILYPLNSCMLLSVFRHLIFASSLMILPLIILGAYKIINREKPYLLIFTTFYALICQFYLFAYIAFGFEIFVLIKSYYPKIKLKEYLKTIIKPNLFFLLGSLLGAFVLTSQLYALISNGRINGNVMIHYSSGYFATLIFGQFLPTPVMSQSNSIGNFFATILIICFFVCIKKEKWLKVWIGVQLPLLLFSVFGYTLSLFAYVNNRWAFILMIPLCLSVGYTLENIKEIKRVTLNTILKSCSYILIVGLILILNFLIKNYLYINNIVSIVLRLSVCLILLVVAYFVYKYDFNKLKLKNYDTFSISIDFIKVTTILIFLFNIGMSFGLTNGYIFYKHYDNQFNASHVNENEFYRVSKYAHVGNWEKMANDSIYGEYSSTFTYNTMNNANMIKFINYFNVTNENNNVGYNGLGKRYILETITGVKYYVSKDSEERNAPYNFSYYDSFESIKSNKNDLNPMYDELLKEDGEYVKENTNIYINNNSLPLGFIYDNYILKSKLDNLTPLERQTYLSKAIILDDTNNINANEYTNLIHKDNIHELDYEIINTKNIVIKDNKILVNSSDNEIQIKVTNLENSELYLELAGLGNEIKFNKTVIDYSSSDEKWTESIFNYGEHLYVDNEDHLLYMGYNNEKEERILTLKFRASGTYNYNSLKLYSVSMNEIISDIQNLKKNSLNDIKISNNKITGNITLENDGILFLSIPYNKGFKAYVNGEEKEILNANIGFMAINLNAGFNEICLQYYTPYLNIGFNISLIALTILIGYSVIDAIISTKKKRIINN